MERWRRSIKIIEENGDSCRLRLFTDREKQAPRLDRYNGKGILFNADCQILLYDLSTYFQGRRREWGRQSATTH